MSAEILNKYEQRLRTYYAQINTENNDHISKELVSKWLTLVLNDAQIGEQETCGEIRNDLDSSFESWIEKYLKQVVQLESEKISNIEFQYEECVEFLSWLLQNNQNQQQNNQQPQQNQINREQPQQDYEEQQSNEQNQHNNHNHSQLKQVQKSSEKKEEYENHDNIQNAPQKEYHEDKINQFSQNLTNQQPTQRTKDILNPNSHQEKQLKLPQQDQRYRQYLETIFQHYCKINFGLAKDNTFESMQKHVSIITINKFMIFANDFQLNILIAASMPKDGKEKPSKVQIRNLIMDIFKKCSHFLKEMNFEQFLQAIQKIGEISFSKMKQSQNYEQSSKTKYSFEMIKMIKYMEILNFKEFREKMTKLNINFSLKFSKQLQEKKMPLNYKFKFESEENKRMEDLYKPPIPNKRISGVKQVQQNVKKHRLHLDMAKPPLNPKHSTPNIPTLENRKASVKQKKTEITRNLPLRLNQASTPNHVRDRNIIPFNAKKNGRSMQKLSQPPHIPQQVIEGYVNVHLAKKGLLLDGNKGLGMKKGEFQLNNVIEQARKQTQAKVYYDALDSRSGRAISNISSSKPLSQYSRHPLSREGLRNNRQDSQLQLLPNQGFHKQEKMMHDKDQVELQKSRLNAHEELKHLIDFNDSDQDEYLHQHLKKETGNDTEIGMRVQKKISTINYKG